MVKIKICGLSREADIMAVNQFLPDYVGFVFAESKRRVTAEQAASLAEKLDFRIEKVGVFVNANPAQIIRLCQQGAIDLVQLHGDEDADYIESLKAKLPNPIIKAVRVQSAQQILAAEHLPCDFLLLDTYTKGQYGGSGANFAWELIPKLTKPFFLAGGLSSENLLSAIAKAKPYAVDISSGVETDGVKDKAKIAKVVAIVRSVS